VTANGEDVPTEGTNQHAGASGDRNTITRDGNTGTTSDRNGAPGVRDAGSSAAASDSSCSANSGTAAAEAAHRANPERRTDGRAEASGTAGLDGSAQQGRPGLTLWVIIDDAKWFSAQASTNARYLAAGGLAVVWALADGKVAGLRRWYMSLAVFGFVLALLGDFVHYALAAKKLIAVIDRNKVARVAYDSVAQVTNADLPATTWFAWKLRVLVTAYVALAWAFVMTVFPEVGDAVRRFAAFATN
jgi:hypothetical protein